MIAKQSELGRKMFEVVEYLKKCGVERPQTLEQIDEALGLRSQENAALIEELRKNERIKFFQGAYSYKVHYLLLMNVHGLPLLQDFGRESAFHVSFSFLFFSFLFFFFFVYDSQGMTW